MTGRVAVIYYGVYPDVRYPDPGNLSLAVKAAVDGIVEAGVLPDDSWKYISELTEAHPQEGRIPALVIELIPASEQESDERNSSNG